MRIGIPLFGLFFVWVFPAFGSPQTGRPPLVLGTGEQRLITIEGLRRYAIGSDLVRAAPSPSGENTLLLKGVKTGATDLWVWKTDGTVEHRTIRVEKWRPPGPLGLWRALGQLREVEVIPLAKAVLLRGEIESAREAAIVEQLLKDHPGRIRNQARLSAALLATGAAKPPSGDPRTVFFRVFLLEVRESDALALGLDWPGRGENVLRVTPWAIRRDLDLQVALENLSRDERVRVLSKPSLALRVGGEAELFSGGELPIRNRSHYTSNVTWRRHGLSLRLKAEALTADTLKLDVSTGVSQLGAERHPDTPPEIRSNLLRTQVEARLGVPLLLSGLTQEREARAREGIPFLSRIPLIGPLFGTVRDASERAELLAVLLPLSAPPEAPMDEFGEEYPRGPVPPPRNWIPLAKLEAMRASRRYPWNAFDP